MPVEDNSSTNLALQVLETIYDVYGPVLIAHSE
jgi:hypothetical protein